MNTFKEKFNMIVTKNDLNESLDKFYDKSEMDEKFDKLLTAVDGLAKEVKNIRLEFASNLVAHDRFEVRIGKLEKVVVGK